MRQKRGALAGALVLLSWLSGCAVKPGVQLDEAIKANKGVVISPLLSEGGGTAWEREGDPDHHFFLMPASEARTRIGQDYQMVVVEPGRYVLRGALVNAGPGRVDPRGLTAPPQMGALGQVQMGTRSYREPYTARVWKDRLVQHHTIPGTPVCVTTGPHGDCLRWVNTPGTTYDQLVQEEGWYEELRYKPAVDVVELLMTFSPRQPMAILEVRPGEAVLVSLMRVVARDAGYDDARCTAQPGTYSHVCPLDRVRAEIAPINPAHFRQQALAPGVRKMDAALVDRVRPVPLQVDGKAVGKTADGLSVVEFGRR